MYASTQSHPGSLRCERVARATKDERPVSLRRVRHPSRRGFAAHLRMTEWRLLVWHRFTSCQGDGLRFPKHAHACHCCTMDVVVEGVSKIWPATRGGSVNAIEHFSHRFRSARITCLLGPSGCGKSTLLQIIGGLEAATSGTI